MKVKIYERIVNDILSDIKSGLLKPNEKLPTNQELAEKYHTSGVTVRKSLATLVNKGYLISIERVGTFVKEREQDLFLVNFSVEGNINEEITAIETEDILISMTKVKGERREVKTLEIRSMYFSGSMPVGYSIDALYLKGRYISEGIEKKTERNIAIIQRIFNSYEVKKIMEVTMDYPNKYISHRLLIDEEMPIFCINLYFSTLEDHPIGKRTFYVLGENIELKGKSFYT
nr:GntR family transcriptional regulator [uncultured Acetobacterium sp.]